MDKIGGLLGGGNKGGAQQQQGAAGGQEDYGDKGLDAIEKKFGGGKINPEQARGVNEKITDGAREMFEKATGKNIPDKYSN